MLGQMAVTENSADPVVENTTAYPVDDWGFEPFQAAHRNDLLELMDDRYGKSATVMISQLPTEE